MTTKRRIVGIHVTPWLAGWRIKVNGRVVGRFTRKADTQSVAVFLAKLMPSATVKTHTRLGKIRGEATYPDSADPPETPG